MGKVDELSRRSNWEREEREIMRRGHC